MEKASGFQKKIYVCFIAYAKAFNCVGHNKLWKILKEVGVPDHFNCLLRNLFVGQKQQLKPDMEQLTDSKLGEEYDKAEYCHPAYLTFMCAEYIMWNAGLDESQVGIKIVRKNNNFRYADLL